ncbi:MAG: ATP-binding protein [Vicinamibacteria bacterium]
MFDDVLGHERIREPLGRALRNGRLPPALLLSGPEGIGKKTLALAVARAMLCDRGLGEVCGECTHCRRLARSLAALPAWRADAADKTDEPDRLNHRLHPDVVLVEAWRTATRTEIKVAQVRDLVGEVAARPFEGRARVFILDDAHAMNDQAANALLKSLEEPPASSHLILVTPSPQALLPTIRSRCQTLRMGPLPTAVVEKYLRERAGLDATEARLRAGLAEGSIGAAASFESGEYRELRDEMLALLESSGEGGTIERLESADRLAERDDPIQALTVLRALLRDVVVLRHGGAAGSLLNADVAGRLEPLSVGVVGERAHALAETAARTRVALRGNANKLLVMDLLVEGLA